MLRIECASVFLFIFFSQNIVENSLSYSLSWVNIYAMLCEKNLYLESAISSCLIFNLISLSFVPKTPH